MRKATLFRTVLLLNAVIIIGAIVFIVIVASSDEFELPFETLSRLALHLLTVLAFANAIVIFPVGGALSAYWYIKLMMNAGPHFRWYYPIRRPENAEFFPDLLPDAAKQHRLHLLAATRISRVGLALILLTFVLAHFSGIAYAA